MPLELDKLVSSDSNYDKMIGGILKTIEGETQNQNTLRRVVLFCKQILANSTQKKKYLCLFLVKDIFQAFPSDYFQKLIDEYIAMTLLGIIQNYVQGKIKSSRTGSEDRETTQKLFHFAVQTVTFWAKKLSVLPKSLFGHAYEELKKMKVQIPSQFMFYKKGQLVQLWKGDAKSQISQHEISPDIAELNQKFKECKITIEKTINEAVLNDEEVLMRPIIKTVREFLVLFFSKYKGLEHEEGVDRDVLIVYFHIMNEFYKKICNQLYISVQELMALTKDSFEANHSSEYESVERRDMIGLGGVFKYNALTIFQRIHQKIEKQQRLLGTCNLSLNLEFEEAPKQTQSRPSRKSIKK